MFQLPPNVKLKVSDYSHSPDPVWEKLEPSIKEAIENYLLYGYEPGGFTTGLLANDLYRAAGSAHHLVLPHLKEMVTWVMNVIPNESYGSYEAVYNWIHDTDNRRSNFAKKVSERIMWRMLNHGN